jgi:small subunit ribosomal protein S9
MAEIQYNATGKRKSSIAQVFMKQGKGDITINNKPLSRYFPYETMKMIVQQPLNVVAVGGKYDITIRVKGGGYSGQASAIRHGISRALVLVNSDYGQKGARKRFQFSKR